MTKPDKRFVELFVRVSVLEVILVGRELATDKLLKKSYNRIMKEVKKKFKEEEVN